MGVPMLPSPMNPTRALEADEAVKSKNSNLRLKCCALKIRIKRHNNTC